MQTEDHEKNLVWTAHPARQRPAAAVLGAAIILAVSVAVHFSFGLAWAALGLIVLILALHRFFFPSRFAIDAEGISTEYVLRKQRLHWSDVRRFVHDRNGGFLSTRSRASRLDAYAGMHLIFSDDRDAIIARIRAHMDKPRETASVDREAGHPQDSSLVARHSSFDGARTCRS